MWYIVALAACVAGDQLLKWWVVSHLEVGQSAPLLPGVMQLTRLHNTGAAWSSFSGKTGLLAMVTIVLMLAVAWLLVKRIVRHPLGVTAGCSFWAAVSATSSTGCAGVCGGYVRPAVYRLPHLQSGGLLCGHRRGAGRRVLPVVLRQVRQEGAEG